MGYRASWLENTGAIADHHESVIHAFDREIPERPMNMLLVGVRNGGSLEVWRSALPEGAQVIGLDNNPDCQALPGVEILECDATVKHAVRAALRGRVFDVVIDSTSTMQPYVWPFLRAGGLYVYEGYRPEMMLMLANDLALDDDSWLPIEEVMRIGVYPGCLVVEKRYPRVIPYMDLMTGNFSDVIPEETLLARGVRRVVV